MKKLGNFPKKQAKSVIFWVGKKKIRISTKFGLKIQ
jgi:hypothetical protein